MLEAAVDKLEKAQARLAAEGTSCPDLDHLLATLRGLEQATQLIPPGAMAARPGANIALPIPLPDAPWSIELFKGLWTFVQAGVTGWGSIGYFTVGPELIERLGTGLGPFGTVYNIGGTRQMSFMLPSEIDSLARQGLLGSLSILQVLAAALLQTVVCPGERYATELAERATCVIKAVWGPAAAAAQRAQRARLERQQWVPAFGGSGAAPEAPSGAEPARGLQRDLQRYCGMSSGSAALQAVWEAALTLRLSALGSLSNPTRPQVQQALCDVQALWDCCPTPADTTARFTSVHQGLTLMTAASEFTGFDRQRRQAAMQLGDEAIARAEGQQCWYSAAQVALTVATVASQMGPLLQSGRLRGAGRAVAGEADDLVRRSREAASRVASYKPRIKPWLPAGLMTVYNGWVQQAAALGGASPAAPAATTDAAAATAGFPVCSHCGCQSLHIRRCAACRGPGYCSKECQREDWPRHKPACKAAVARAAASAQSAP